MRDTDGVLAAIDGALDDYYTSEDAMRWSPAPPPRLRLDPQAVEAFSRMCGRVVAVVRAHEPAFKAWGESVARALNEMAPLVRRLQVTPGLLPSRTEQAGRRRVECQMRTMRRRAARRERRTA